MFTYDCAKKRSSILSRMLPSALELNSTPALGSCICNPLLWRIAIILRAPAFQLKDKETIEIHSEIETHKYLSRTPHRY